MSFIIKNKFIFLVTLLSLALFSYSKSPAQAACTLRDAYWTQNFCGPPILGSPLHMIVDATGCAGYQLDFEVYDKGIPTFSGGHVGKGIKGTFDSYGYKADVIWIAAGYDLDHTPLDWTSKAGTDFHFRFFASANMQTKQSNDIIVPTNSQNGCINCNTLLSAVAPPNPCRCADGYSAKPGLLDGPTCSSICTSHTGDSLTDSCGSPSSPGTPGKPQDLSYDLTKYNPLKGGEHNILNVVIILSTWIFHLAIALVTILIIYAGIRFLLSRGNTGEVEQAKKMLWYALVGLAIVLIGKGFISLIASILGG